MKAHWTARSIKDYLFRIAADFIAQLDNEMDTSHITQDELAKKLGVTKGRVLSRITFFELQPILLLNWIMKWTHRILPKMNLPKN